MKTFFLKLKHWQIFLLLFVPSIFLVILGGVLQSDPLKIILPFLSAFIMGFIYNGWLWTIGHLNNYLYPETKQKFSIFRFLFRLALILAFLIIPILRNTDMSLIVIHILSAFSLIVFLFCIYLITNALHSIEKQKYGKVNSVFNDFILIWIMPIGIWFIQPRINKIELDLNDQTKTTDTESENDQP